MAVNCKFSFALKNKFQPCLSSRYPVYLTESDKLYCGRLVDDSVVISILDGETLNITEKIESYHQKVVQIMALNKDSTRLASGSVDAVIRLWHIGPKEGFTATCRLHSSMITLLRFHPTLPYLFSSSMTETIVAVWDSTTGALVTSLDSHQSTVTGLDFNLETKLIATCGRDKVIIMWTCPGFQKQKVIPTFESLDCCVFLPIGALSNHLGPTFKETEQSLLLTGGQWGCLRVWDSTHGRCVLEIKGPLDRTPKSSIGMSSIDRHSIEYGLHSICDLKLVHINKSPLGNLEGINEEISGSKLVLLRQSNHIEFYDPMVAKLTSEFLGDIGQVDQLCVAGKNKNYLILADASPDLKLFLNPCGLHCTTYTKNQMSSWQCHLIPGGHKDVIMDLTVSACGQWIASGSKDQSICLWHLIEHDEVGSVDRRNTKVDMVANLENAHSAHVTAVCFDKLTSYLISASVDGVLKVWNVNLANIDNADSLFSERQFIPRAHSDTISAIDVAINNQFVATASRDKTVKIWKFQKSGLECQGVLQGHRRGVWSVCFSSREKIVLTASADGDVKLWNLKDFSCIKTLEGHEQPVYKATFLSEDKQVLSCDQNGLVRLWDIGKFANKNTVDLTKKPGITDVNSKVFEAHEGRIWSLVVCPDESGFFTGGEDETLCYFEDISEQLCEQSTKEREQFIQTQQLLENLLYEQKYPEALHLAVQLDQPKRTLDILQEIFLMDLKEFGNVQPQSNSTCFIQLECLHKILDTFIRSNLDESLSVQQLNSNKLVQRLLDYVINWNTRARTSIIGQSILNWVLTRWSPNELVKWPNIDRIVESLLPYTSRHYQRISRLEEQLAILDYVTELNHQQDDKVNNLQTSYVHSTMEVDND